jgi:2,5-dihydroxypyridine 5,6-dioxygenase
VLIHTDTVFNPVYPAACLAAALSLGAEVFILTVPAARPERGSRCLQHAWQDADLVVDMVSAGAHAYYSSLNRVLDGGVRILRVAEELDVLRTLFPDPVVRTRSRADAALLDRAEEIRITSAAGTDLRLNKTGRPGVAYYGAADEPGRWDQWPSGLVACAPLEESAEGRLVIEPGDVFLGWGQMVRSPIRCEFAGGRVQAIEGGAEAARLQATLAAHNDPRARVLGIVGWGTDPRARWYRVLDRLPDPGGIMDTETFAGNLLLVLGSNTSVSLGGRNATPCHINVDCRNHSIYLDGQPVVEIGRLVGQPINEVE